MHYVVSREGVPCETKRYECTAQFANVEMSDDQLCMQGVYSPQVLEEGGVVNSLWKITIKI